ncbi:pancreatic secretory granule membrane major glycoprotein GP2-like [Liolophura sinensis]|uniref:pancreatic secretory granule membrane major glycoprotein GP2-like n=1 Tax=Liolophura sinensis TaxID=3198878 RepID=UPI0031598EAB
MAMLLLSVIVGSLTFTPALFQALNPCQSNAVLSGTVLRSFDNVKNFSDIENAYCDISLSDGWYRLKVDTKDVDLAQSVPPPGSCNAYYPIWMNGSVPTILNQKTSAKACMVTSQDSDCGVSLDIEVMNCGEYNVYYLRPPDTCPAAYCLDIRAPCPEGTSSETGTYPDCSVNFPRVNVTPSVEPLLGISVENAAFQDLRFQCVFTPLTQVISTTSCGE